MSVGFRSPPAAAGRGRAGAALLRSLLLIVPALPLMGHAALAAPAPAATPRAAAPAVQVQRPADPAPARPAATQDADGGTRNVAARARMSECGHQWNNMKRTGAATGTWKEFSRGCLAQK